MKKFLLIINLLIFSSIYSQITYSIAIKKKISNNSFIIKLVINNLSDENYIIPIDTSGFKALYQDERCGMINLEYPYKYFSPNILLKQTNNGKTLEAYSKTYDIPEKSISKIEKHFDSIKQREVDLIKNWALKEKLNNIDMAERNYYIFKNLIVLKAKDTFSTEILLDIFNIKRSESSLNYDSYATIPNMNYSINSEICIDRNIYRYFTKNQKKKLRGYKMFSGLLVSNSIQLK